MKKRHFPLLLCGYTFLSGCVNLQSVNLFSTSAVLSLHQHVTLPTTFTDVYRQRVENDSLDRHPFGQVQLVGLDFSGQVRQDSLRSYQQADSLAQAGSALLAAYFQALADLSVTGSGFVPVRLKSATFDRFLQHSAVKLTPEQTASFNGVANLLTSAATGAYRRRKLATLLERSHDDVGQVLAVLAFTYERLAGVVSISREQHYGSYKNGLIQDAALTYTQKRDLARQWLRTSRTIEKTHQTVQAYVTTLKTVRAGYDELYRNRHQLNSKALLSSLGSYASTLKQLATDLEQLNPVYGRFNP